METCINLTDTSLMEIDVQTILDSLNDGVYVCDRTRRVVYWSKAAERITGWTAEDMVGNYCFDHILAHVDKDGHKLCGKEHCPLHRAIVTGIPSKAPVLMFALKKDGKRVPMLANVAPLRNANGEIIGGVESFQDASVLATDLEKARAIQEIAMQYDLPADERIRFNTYYIPTGIVGGDYYAIAKLDEDRYGIMLADVMGHGIAAATYTMHLGALWNQYHLLLVNPVEFTSKLNNELVKVVKTDTSFATAICGVVDLKRQIFRFTSAGAPHVLLMHADSTHEFFRRSGLPLAVMEDADYGETDIELQEGDRLLLFSDGAIEIRNAEGEMLGYDGLLEFIKEQGYPVDDLDMQTLEENLLKRSTGIRLEDDLTLVEVCL